MFDVVAIGELLIDFTPAGKSPKGNPIFEANPGGAPGNVLAALSKLGMKTAFIGKVGNDQFGRELAETLRNCGVDTSGLVFSDTVRTTLAFVHLDSSGERFFSFFRNPGADMTISPEEVNFELVENTRIFHFGTLSMTHEPARTATLQAVIKAKNAGSMVSFDPNLRKSLWDRINDAKEMMAKGMELADIVKLSEEELQFLTGMKDCEEGSRELWKTYGNRLIFVTLGSRGCFYRMNGVTGYRPGYRVPVKDTTGAGDAFLGAVLYRILSGNVDLSNCQPSLLEEIADFSNAAGALVTTGLGAIPSMPTLEQIRTLMRESTFR
jgi:fructokinase